MSVQNKRRLQSIGLLLNKRHKGLWNQSRSKRCWGMVRNTPWKFSDGRRPSETQARPLQQEQSWATGRDHHLWYGGGGARPQVCPRLQFWVLLLELLWVLLCELTLPLEGNLICFSSDWSGLSLHGWLCQGERWAPKGWQECTFYDFCWFQVNKSEDVEVVCNILVVPQFLSRLKQICECQVWSTLYTLHSQFIDSMSNNSMFQLARLLTLMNVAELFPFFVYYLADQLQRSAM